MFIDPKIMNLWERLMYEITPDGQIAPYGASSGWNSSAAERVWMLEIIATRTGDGRFRWASHRFWNYLHSDEEL